MSFDRTPRIFVYREQGFGLIGEDEKQRIGKFAEIRGISYGALVARLDWLGRRVVDVGPLGAGTGSDGRCTLRLLAEMLNAASRNKSYGKVFGPYLSRGILNYPVVEIFTRQSPNGYPIGLKAAFRKDDIERKDPALIAPNLINLDESFIRKGLEPGELEELAIEL
ncbi:hypothetical protein KY325_01135, partial [Candidatus Woesearchaeota archaeon]|nr:hypothetical protein [Candidatus Woesearchaeota archaeon]